MAGLERLVDADPGDAVALGKLIDCADLAGPTERVRAFRRQKDEIDREMRVTILFGANHLLADAAELSRVATRLGATSKHVPSRAC